jgi:hypothetical protein
MRELLQYVTAFRMVNALYLGAGIATGYGLDGRRVRVRVPVVARFFSSSSSPVEAHTASYPMSTGGSFPGDKTAEAN